MTKSKGASSVVWVTEYQYHERRIVQVKLMTVAGGLAVVTPDDARKMSSANR